MPKERNFNPVQAQRKADKAKAIKKACPSKSERLQKQIDDLKAIATGGGKLSRHEEQVLEGLEKELRAVKKAREALGDKAPSFGHGGFHRDGDSSRGVLGKRRRDDDELTSDEDVPGDVKRIPMPRDTPPPIPKEVMDKWYAKRRARRQAEQAENQKLEEKEDKPTAPEPKTVYEAKPMVRNLAKEAVSAFVPTAVKIKMDKGKGQSGLMEPEEADRLEQEGYLKAVTSIDKTETDAPRKAWLKMLTMTISDLIRIAHLNFDSQIVSMIHAEKAWQGDWTVHNLVASHTTKSFSQHTKLSERRDYFRLAAYLTASFVISVLLHKPLSSSYQSQFAEQTHPVSALQAVMGYGEHLHC
ncbi:WW domain binding protein 11 [Colletotrichum tofieldiae]|nr:WW domain binding protein 11 [Colletotrichum tofieldiae]